MKIKLIAKIASLKAIEVKYMSPSEQQRHKTRIAELETELEWLRKCEEMARSLNEDALTKPSIETKEYYPKPSLN